MDRCADCKYFIESKPSLKLGDCHRYPPGERGTWAVVQHDGWCGEHRPKPDLPKEGKK